MPSWSSIITLALAESCKIKNDCLFVCKKQKERNKKQNKIKSRSVVLEIIRPSPLITDRHMYEDETIQADKHRNTDRHYQFIMRPLFIEKIHGVA